MLVDQLGPSGDVSIKRTGAHMLTLDAHVDVVEGVAVKGMNIKGVSLSDYVNKIVAEALQKKK